MKLETWCSNCGRETIHDHEHGPEGGREKCILRCRFCGEESGFLMVSGSGTSTFSAHDVNECALA